MLGKPIVMESSVGSGASMREFWMCKGLGVCLVCVWLMK